MPLKTADPTPRPPSVSKSGWRKARRGTEMPYLERKRAASRSRRRKVPPGRQVIHTWPSVTAKKVLVFSIPYSVPRNNSDYPAAGVGLLRATPVSGVHRRARCTLNADEICKRNQGGPTTARFGMGIPAAARTDLASAPWLGFIGKATPISSGRGLGHWHFPRPRSAPRSEWSPMSRKRTFAL